MIITPENGASYTVEALLAKGEFRACTNGIAAKETGDLFTVQPYVVIDGVEYMGPVKEYSVLHFAETQLRKTTARQSLKNAMIGLVQYATQAQYVLNYKTNEPANALLDKLVAEGVLDASQLELVWDGSLLTTPTEPDADMVVNFTQSSTLTDNGKTLALDGAISVNFYVGVDASVAELFDEAVTTRYFWTEADYAALKAAGTPLTKENASYSVAGNPMTYHSKYGYEIGFQSEQIFPKELGNTLYSATVIVDEAGNVHTSEVAVYSPEAYAINILNNGKTDSTEILVQWMTYYGENAKVYLSGK